MGARFQKTSLRLRLVAAISLVMVVTMAIGLALTYGHARRKVAVEMAAAMMGGRNIVEREIEELDATPEGARDLPGLVRVFDGNRHIRAQLLGASGAVLYASRPDASESEIPDVLLRVLGGPAEVYRREVALSPTTRGAVILETDARSEVGEVSGDAALDLTVLLILFGLVLVTVNALLARALASFGSLNAAFERIGRSDYAARVAESGPPEFARLSRNCNAMAVQLGRMDAHARRLGHQLSTVQEEERADLARNLHDEISPFLFAVDVDAAAIRASAGDAQQPAIAARATAIREATAHMKAEVRALLGRLRSNAAPDLGLGDAIADLVARARARHPQATIRTDLAHGTADAATETVIHHVVREALSNALQHGEPRNVAISVSEQPGALRVRIIDDGRGLASPALTRPRLAGYGVLGMRERVEARGGRFSIGPGLYGRGVSVEALVPLGAARDADADSRVEEPA